jgi:hypothetical protein
VNKNYNNKAEAIPFHLYKLTGKKPKLVSQKYSK